MLTKEQRELLGDTQEMEAHDQKSLCAWEAFLYTLPHIMVPPAQVINLESAKSADHK